MINILIADDQKLIIDGLKMILDLEDSIQVIATAKNGLECLEKSKSLKPDLILMDIRMPKMNGIEATKRIKESNPDIIIIALSTFNDKRNVKKIFELGADGYVLKDIDSDSLVDIIKKAVNGNFLLSDYVVQALLSENKKYNFTDLEMRIAESLSEGVSNKEIAKKLNIAYGTVRNKVSSIYKKINTKNRAKAVIILRKHFKNDIQL